MPRTLAYWMSGGAEVLQTYRLEEGGPTFVRKWSLDGNPPVELGRLPEQIRFPADLHRNGKWAAYAVNVLPEDTNGKPSADYYRFALDELETTAPEHIGRLEGANTKRLWLHADGEHAGVDP